MSNLWEVEISSGPVNPGRMALPATTMAQIRKNRNRGSSTSGGGTVDSDLSGNEDAGLSLRKVLETPWQRRGSASISATHRTQRKRFFSKVVPQRLIVISQSKLKLKQSTDVSKEEFNEHPQAVLL
jgi:hypothetical protein